MKEKVVIILTILFFVILNETFALHSLKNNSNNAIKNSSTEYNSHTKNVDFQTSDPPYFKND